MYERESLAGGVADEIRNLIGADRFDRILKSVNYEQSHELLKTIDELISPLFVDDLDIRERLRQSRAIFESALAQDVAKDPIKRARWKENVEPIHSEMKTIVSSNVDDDRKRRFWNLDGEFHICLGDAANVPHIRDVVRRIQDRVCMLAFPANHDDMVSTCDEHEEIIRSILDASWDDNRIVDSVQVHTKLAFGRWFRVGSMDTDVQMSDIVTEIAKYASEGERRLGRPAPELAEAISLAIRDIAAQSEKLDRSEADFAFESLLMQHQFPGEYVAFREAYESHEGTEHYVLSVRHHTANWDEMCRFIEESDEELCVEFQPHPICNVA